MEETVSTSKTNEKKAKLDKKSKNRAEIIFLFVILCIPLLKVAIFYVGVNINSVLFAFQTYKDGEYFITGFQNFSAVIKDFSGSGALLGTLKNSLVLYFSGLIFGLPLSLLFSFYIAKHAFGGTVFKIILFLPSIISNLVEILMFQYLVEDGLSHIVGFNMLTDARTTFPLLVFYSIYMGFGTGIIMYSNAMATINPGVIEAGQIEGMNYLQEFWYITLPSVFPTITSFLVSGVSSIFVANLGLYSFFGDSADYSVQTIGYYLFVKVIGDKATPADYPYAAAAGLLFTLICVPLTMTAKTLLEKYGPSEE